MNIGHRILEGLNYFSMHNVAGEDMLIALVPDLEALIAEVAPIKNFISVLTHQELTRTERYSISQRANRYHGVRVEEASFVGKFIIMFDPLRLADTIVIDEIGAIQVVGFKTGLKCIEAISEVHCSRLPRPVIKRWGDGVK